MMKCDNDIFLKSDVLDYMINNLHLLVLINRILNRVVQIQRGEARLVYC